MLRCEALTVRYPDGDAEVFPFHGLSFELEGQPVAVVGPSGSGKSTLLRVIAGIQAPDSGRVLIDDIPVRHNPADPEMDSRVAMVHQDYRLVDFLTVRENVLLAAELRARDWSERQLSDAMEAFGLDGLGARLPGQLSGGQQQRVALVRALASGCRVLLADEPTGALDDENSRVVAESLIRLAGLGVQVVVATHDPGIADRMTHRVALR